VVAGAGRDHQERYAVFGGYPGDQRLGTVAAGHPEQVGPTGHRRASQGDDIHLLGALQPRDPGTPLLSPFR